MTDHNVDTSGTWSPTHLGSHEERLDVRLGDIKGQVAKMDGVWRASRELNGSTRRETRLFSVSKS